jgi:MerR family transcriptional regulator, thiopeptide resistance regulator
MDDELTTIGELAERIGITVRTLQYYDQAGILKPSVKGSRNQRLYSASDVEELYRILCLKFMGFSIDEIKQQDHGHDDAATVHALFEEKITAMEREFSELLSRFTALKNLATVTRNDSEVDWTRYAGIIEDFQDDGRYFWQLSCVYEDNTSSSLLADLRDVEEREREDRRRQSFRDWHELIADSIVLMHEEIPFDDPRCQEVARRYRDLRAFHGQFPPARHFILSDDAKGKDPAHLAFGGLRNDVNDYLEQAAAALDDES